jgi:DNA polymerase III alpha subunit
MQAAMAARMGGGRNMLQIAKDVGKNNDPVYRQIVVKHWMLGELSRLNSERAGAEARSGNMVEFLTLEDEQGVFEVTVWPAVYRRVAANVRGLGPYVVTGTVEDRIGAVAVNAEDIIPVLKAAGARSWLSGTPSPS